MEISLSESALGDLEAIKQYYLDEDVPHIGVEFVTAIVKHIERLLDHPEIGRVVPEFGESHIRELIHPPFRVVYFLSKESIQVVRVWRSERLLKIDE